MINIFLSRVITEVKVQTIPQVANCLLACFEEGNVRGTNANEFFRILDATSVRSSNLQKSGASMYKWVAWLFILHKSSGSATLLSLTRSSYALETSTFSQSFTRDVEGHTSCNSKAQSSSGKCRHPNLRVQSRVSHQKDAQLFHLELQQ